MKLVKSWRFAIKCMKLSYNLKGTLVSIGFFFVMALIYEITGIAKGVGAILLLTVAMYPAQMIYSVCGSQLVQSSPYKKAMMTSLPVVITFCSSTLIYLAVIGIEGIRAIRNPEAAEYSVPTILLVGVVVVLLNVYAGFVYRYFVVSMIVMVIGIVGVYYTMSVFGNSAMALPWFTEISMPMAIAAGLCLSVLGSLLQYSISLLVYKKPVSRRAIYGLLRQQS